MDLRAFFCTSIFEERLAAVKIFLVFPHLLLYLIRSFGELAERSARKRRISPVR